jgi:hypothetical protein
MKKFGLSKKIVMSSALFFLSNTSWTMMLGHSQGADEIGREPVEDDTVIVGENLMEKMVLEDMTREPTHFDGVPNAKVALLLSIRTVRISIDEDERIYIFYWHFFEQYGDMVVSEYQLGEDIKDIGLKKTFFFGVAGDVPMYNKIRRHLREKDNPEFLADSIPVLLESSWEEVCRDTINAQEEARRGTT